MERSLTVTPSAPVAEVSKSTARPVPLAKRERASLIEATFDTVINGT